MERIIILGPPGVGKTTLASKLGKELNLSVLHLDAIHFEKNWIMKDKKIVKEELATFLKDNNRWVIDGNWRHCLPLRIDNADKIIYLDYGLEISKKGCLERNAKFNGKARPDIPQCIESLEEDFLEFVETFEETEGKDLKEYINNLDKKIDIHIFISRKECNNFLEGKV